MGTIITGAQLTGHSAIDPDREFVRLGWTPLRFTGRGSFVTRVAAPTR